MVFFQLQLTYLYYLKLYLIVLQNYSLCETLIKSFEAKQHNQQQEINKSLKNHHRLLDISRFTTHAHFPKTGPNIGFKAGQRYECITSLERHKRQKILPTDRSFVFVLCLF